MTLNIHEFMQTLAEKRPIFHSEADFQHSFAWELQKKFPIASIRLEYPYKPDQLLQTNKRKYLDIWVSMDQIGLAIELKYKTSQLQTSFNNEMFSLTNHSAQPPSRYDFVKDISRLENMIAVRPKFEGYAIMLTNDSVYWRTIEREKVVIDTSFRFPDRHTLSGRLDWGINTSKGTKSGRESSIDLLGKYDVTWHDYSNIIAPKNGLFRYLVIPIRLR